MSGRLQDAWCYSWSDIWQPIDEAGVWANLADHQGYTLDQFYLDTFVELAKAYKKAFPPLIYETNAADPIAARDALLTTTALHLRSESAVARFFEDVFDVVTESGSDELAALYKERLLHFLRSRNLRYELVEPFRLQAHLPGAFSALYADIEKATSRSQQLQGALCDFTHSLRALANTHTESDAKTCILKATMLAEALASSAPGAQGQTLAELCNSLTCWPHPALKDAVKKIYGFCSDYPGIRHNISAGGQLRALSTHDSVIVPLLLMSASGYFSSNNDLLDTLRGHGADPAQEPPEPPTITQPAGEVSIP